MARTANRIPEVTLEGVRLVFKNFSGEERRYNAEGKRNFCVILPQNVAEDMDADGWNIKTLTSRDEDEQDASFIKVNVNYNSGRPPRVVVLAGRNRTTLTEETVGSLDWAEITNVDLTISPFVREDNGEVSVTAYLKTMYVTIDQDPLDAKYAEDPSEE
jgi:hypothetical protein